MVEMDLHKHGSARIQVIPGGERSSSTCKCQDTGNTWLRRIFKYLEVPEYRYHMVEKDLQVPGSVSIQVTPDGEGSSST